MLETPWPIRQIQFLTAKVGWAAGGNIYSGVGGIYYTSNGGKTWVLDATPATRSARAHRTRTASGTRTRVWCIGSAFNGSQFESTVYRTTVATP